MGSYVYTIYIFFYHIIVYRVNKSLLKYGRLRLIIEDFAGVNFRSDIIILNKSNF